MPEELKVKDDVGEKVKLHTRIEVNGRIYEEGRKSYKDGKMFIWLGKSGLQYFPETDTVRTANVICFETGRIIEESKIVPHREANWLKDTI